MNLQSYKIDCCKFMSSRFIHLINIYSNLLIQVQQEEHKNFLDLIENCLFIFHRKLQLVTIEESTTGNCLNPLVNT